MDMSESCDGHVRELWWMCQGAVMDMSESCDGCVRELWWICQEAVVDKQEYQGKFVNDGRDNSLSLLLTKTVIINMTHFKRYAVIPVPRPWALC